MAISQVISTPNVKDNFPKSANTMTIKDNAIKQVVKNLNHQQIKHHLNSQKGPHQIMFNLLLITSIKNTQTERTQNDKFLVNILSVSLLLLLLLFLFADQYHYWIHFSERTSITMMYYIEQNLQMNYLLRFKFIRN